MGTWRRLRGRPFQLAAVGLLILLSGLILWGEERASSAADLSLDVVLAPPPGRYLEEIRLRLQTPHPDATIYYTLDGRAPDPQTGQRYDAPLLLSATAPQVVPVRARAFLADGTAGPQTSGTYFMGLETALPMLSVIVDPDDLYGVERGIYVNHEERGREWERPVDLTYVTSEGETAFRSGAGLRIHGEWTRWFFDKKSLRLYFREEYGARKLAYPLFGPQGQVAFDHLYLHNSDQDLLLFRNQLVERLATNMGAFTTRSRPVLLFINGEPWGIYNIRERIDERFLEQAYDVPDASVMDTPNIPSRQSEQQRAVDLPHWQAFMAFVKAEDLADPDNYTYLQTQMDVANFVDYFLLQMYAANTDWPHHNVEQFRPWTQGGRWEFLPWDSDLAFERVDRQMVGHVLEAVHPLGEGMETLLNKLLANPEFYNLFLTRAADLLNTSLSAANVSAEVEGLLVELGQDVGLEQARWNVPGTWEDTAVHMQEFAAQRPEIMRGHFVESFGLAGTATIAFAAGDAPGGWVVVNENVPQALPWQGIYFLGTTISLRVLPPAGYRFAGWAGAPAEVAADGVVTLLPVTGDLVLTPRFEPLAPGEAGPGDATITAVHVDDHGAISGDWLELQIGREGLDLRGWRLTDNDTLTVADEGSLVFGDDPLLADLPAGTMVRIIATENMANAERFREDGWVEGVLILYAGNGRLDISTDPWFNLGGKDNLLLLAPGRSAAFADDVAVDLWSTTTAVTRADFGLPQQP
jgi:hypothetical protein